MYSVSQSMEVLGYNTTLQAVDLSNCRNQPFVFSSVLCRHSAEIPFFVPEKAYLRVLKSQGTL